jgi:hypothetical protein
MREDIKKLSGRGEDLASLQGKADDLVIPSDGSCCDANKVKERMCFKYIKIHMYLIGCVIFLLVVLLIVPVLTLVLQRHG